MKRGIKLLLAGFAITAAIIAVTPLIVIQKIRIQIRQAGAIPCDSGGPCANLLEACDAGGNRGAFRAGPILAKLAAIRGVDALVMRNIPLASRDLTDLARFRDVVYIDVSGTSIDEECIRNISRVKTLQTLDCTGCGIGDEAVRAMHEMNQLQDLYVANVPLTDRSIETFAVLPSLKNLDLRGTQISEEGIAQLLRANPGLKVQRGRL